MPDWPRFPKAPITEALLDIRVKLPPEVDLARVGAIHEAIRDRYPQRRERKSWHGGLAVKEGELEVLPTTGGPDGYLFTSLDGRQIVQARLDGFTFNRLAPYEWWERFRDEARLYWDRYREITEPTAVTRIALRYINRLKLPLPIKDFKDWVLTTPEVAPDLPQGLRTFFMRLEIPDPSGAITILTETIDPREAPTGTGEKVLALILDIDVIQTREFPPDSEAIWVSFEYLRDLKNEFFFKSVTERAKELFR